MFLANIFINRNYDKPRSREINKKFLSHYQHKKILELGPQRYPMKSYYPSIKTFDIDPRMKPDILGDADNMDMIKNDTYDVVYSCHFLEHVYNPEKVLKECNRVLKPGGILYFCVPVVDINRIWKDGDEWNTHQHHFTKMNITNLLNSTGFKLVKFEYRLWIKPIILEVFLGNLLKKGDIFFVAEKKS